MKIKRIKHASYWVLTVFGIEITGRDAVQLGRHDVSYNLLLTVRRKVDYLGAYGLKIDWLENFSHSLPYRSPTNRGSIPGKGKAYALFFKTSHPSSHSMGTG
jgi:hypothetical protein